MNSCEIVGWTHPDGYCLCTGHGSDDGICQPIFASSEWDHYPTCDECHEKIEAVSLTEEGIAYEAQYEENHEEELTPEAYDTLMLEQLEKHCLQSIGQEASRTLPDGRRCCIKRDLTMQPYWECWVGASLHWGADTSKELLRLGREMHHVDIFEVTEEQEN